MVFLGTKAETKNEAISRDLKTMSMMLLYNL